MPPSKKVEEYADDEVINVTLSRKDYLVMRDIIERQKSLNWIGKYVKTTLFVFAGGILTLVAFWGVFVDTAKSALGIK